MRLAKSPAALRPAAADRSPLLAGIDERTRKGRNSLKWCGSPERKQFYDNHPADQESKDFTNLLEAGA